MERASALAVAADLLLQEWISTPTSATKLAVKALRLSMDSQVLVPGFALFAAPPPDEEGWTELRSLLRRARQFSSDALMPQVQLWIRLRKTFTRLLKHLLLVILNMRK